MRCSRLVSAILTAVVLGLAVAGNVSPAYADEQAPALSAQEDEDSDGASAGDILGMLTDPQVVGVIAQATSAAIGSAAIGSAAADGVGAVAEGAAGGIAGSMTQGAISLLEEFASWWTSWTVIDLRESGIDSPLGLALGFAMLVAWLLLVVEAGRAAYSGDGTAIGNALVGLLKVTVVVTLLVPFVQAMLYASDELTDWIGLVVRRHDGPRGQAHQPVHLRPHPGDRADVRLRPRRHRPRAATDVRVRAAARRHPHHALRRAHRRRQHDRPSHVDLVAQGGSRPADADHAQAGGGVHLRHRLRHPR